MNLSLLHPEWVAPVIDLGGSALIVAYALYAVLAIIRTRDIPHARLLVAEGALAGLSFKLAATLLNTILLHTWSQILVFAAIFGIRTIIKSVFAWEERHIGHSLAPLLPRGGAGPSAQG